MDIRAVCVPARGVLQPRGKVTKLLPVLISPPNIPYVLAMPEGVLDNGAVLFKPELPIAVP